MEFLQHEKGADGLITEALGKSMALELDKAVFFGHLGAKGTNDEGAAYGLASQYPKRILKNLNENEKGKVVG